MEKRKQFNFYLLLMLTLCALYAYMIHCFTHIYMQYNRIYVNVGYILEPVPCAIFYVKSPFPSETYPSWLAVRENIHF